MRFPARHATVPPKTVQPMTTEGRRPTQVGVKRPPGAGRALAGP